MVFVSIAVLILYFIYFVFCQVSFDSGSNSDEMLPNYINIHIYIHIYIYVHIYVCIHLHIYLF